nr:MAG TPA: DNA polymerase II small subunit [Caudoviricetes sp.]
MDDVLKIMPHETEDECLMRIGEAKRDGLLDVKWVDIAEFFNKAFRADETEYRTESSYRKKFKNYIDAKNLFVKQNLNDVDMSEELSMKLREIEKAKIKLRDERTDYQKSLREDARRESFIELIERVMKEEINAFDYKASPVINSDDDMVVCLSDLHAGIEIDNWWNVYNTQILKNRLHKYLNEIHKIQKTHQCKICHVVLGGDAISGAIHENLRLQNNENVIEQLKIVITYIGEFIYILQEWFESINIYSVSGNHSRLNPNKEYHLKGEELEEMIPFCLKIQFAQNDKVSVCDYMACKIDSTISAFKTRGNKLFYVVHGDHDTPSNVVKNLTLMSGTKPDGIIMGHRHNNALSTEHGVKIIQCGSVVGTDDYCVDKRISGEPEQCVFITNEHRTIQCLYDIGLN